MLYSLASPPLDNSAQLEFDPHYSKTMESRHRSVILNTDHRRDEASRKPEETLSLLTQAKIPNLSSSLVDSPTCGASFDCADDPAKEIRGRDGETDGTRQHSRSRPPMNMRQRIPLVSAFP